ncbi:hypothetical protein ACFC1B_29355 [Streptomyces xiamenensis]|uniref:hypothetical protein n=1 Tax=Streptomyces xiamenensis TaxID=408015 RepID=UPI0035DD8BC7
MSTALDRRIWQMDAARALLRLLEAGHRAALPAIDWRVQASRLLVGEPAPGPAGDRLAAVHAWAAHLGVEVGETASRGLVVHRAAAQVGEPGHSPVDVTITTRIHTD